MAHFYLIRTDSNQNTLRILSHHMSAENARAADRKLQRMTKRHSGSSSYVPTAIVKTERKVRGLWVTPEDSPEAVSDY